MKIRYTHHCKNCGWKTSTYVDADDVPRIGRSFAVGSGDLSGKTCRCGNGGFVFQLNSRRGEEILGRNLFDDKEEREDGERQLEKLG